jgi:hypothetical protein
MKILFLVLMYGTILLMAHFSVPTLTKASKGRTTR